jgi:hypothetical protein
MKEQDNIYDKIRELMGGNPGSLTVMEQQIDADVQLEYYHCAKNMDSDFDSEKVLREKDVLFMQDLPVEIKKKLLIQLATIGKIEAFRTLEKFVHNRENGLTDWATLALQENRLLLESRLLDENQVLISSGLGGKGLKLRYFTVLMTRTGMDFSDFEKKLVISEVRFALKNCRGELETIYFDRELCRILSVIPLQVPIQGLFDSIIKECNQYGDFLNPDCMITNVKILSVNQIRKLMRPKRTKKNPDKI